MVDGIVGGLKGKRRATIAARAQSLGTLDNQLSKLLLREEIRTGLDKYSFQIISISEEQKNDASHKAFPATLVPDKSPMSKICAAVFLIGLEAVAFANSERKPGPSPKLLIFLSISLSRIQSVENARKLILHGSTTTQGIIAGFIVMYEEKRKD